MKRLGRFTGKVYSQEDYDGDIIKECCLLISDEQASDEDFIRKQHLKDIIVCSSCLGLP